MAKVTINQPLNQSVDFAVDLLETTQASTSQIVTTTSRGTTFEFLGNFAYGFNGNIVGGTINQITEYMPGGAPWWKIAGIALPAKTYVQYAVNDDIAGLQSLVLGSNDTINGSYGNDKIFGFAGNDVIIGGDGLDNVNGNQGSDTITGGTNNDNLLGGKDNDSINGNAGNDNVNGNMGNDTVRGGQGNDTVHGGQDNDHIYGDTGNDTLYGDLGSDTFVFAPGSGVDIIADYQDGTDRIQLQNFGIGNFNALTPHISQNGSNAVITFGNDSITLSGVSASALDAGDFLFS